VDAPIELTRAILSFGAIGHRNEDQVVVNFLAEMVVTSRPHTVRLGSIFVATRMV
jgi:hypothetical protein